MKDTEKTAYGSDTGKYKIRDRLLILTGGVLQLFPLIYWLLTEGKKPLYLEVALLPRGMLLVAVLVAVMDCVINRRFIRKRNGIVWMFLVQVALLAALYAAQLVEIISFGERNGMDEAVLFLFTGVLLYLLLLYEILMLVIHAVTAGLYALVRKGIRRFGNR